VPEVALSPEVPALPVEPFETEEPDVHEVADKPL
jgi:hypothetical protein